LKITEIRAHTLIFIATLLVAGAFLSSARLADVANSFSLTLLRFIGASLILAPVVLYKKEWRCKIISTLPRAMVISFFYTSFFIGFFEALRTTTPINTGAIFTLVPLLTSLISVVVLKTQISRKQLGVYLMGVLATTWVVFNGDLALLLSLTFNKGDLIFLGSIFLQCCFTVSMKLLYRNDDMIVLVFTILLGGVIWMLLAKPVLAYPLDWHLVKGASILHMLYLIIAATLATVYLFQRTTVILGPSRVSAYIFLNPALVALLLLVIDGTAIPVRIVPAIILSAMATLMLQKNADMRV
jgi:drug/metabolite transporter (DMT)-like permease